MKRLFFYTIATLLGIFATVSIRNDFGWFYPLTLLYLLTTAAVTLRLVSRKREIETNPTTDPVYYYARESSLEWSTYLRGGLMVLATFLLALNISQWWLFLIMIWVISLATLALPVLTARALNWNIIKEAIYQENKTKLSQLEVSAIYERIRQIPTSQLLKKNRNWSNRLSQTENKAVTDLYLKMIRETR